MSRSSGVADLRRRGGSLDLTSRCVGAPPRSWHRSVLPSGPVGSGLILLVIVGAWLAVLVPMALRSHDATSVRSAERFGDAMRVLSPRSRRASSPRPDGEPSVAEPPPALEPLLHSLREDDPRPPLTLVERRRRVLLSLLGGAAAFLLGGLVSGWSLVVGVLLLGLAAAYVVHLRRLQVARAERSLFADADPWAAPDVDDERVPLRAPVPSQPLRRPLPAPALRDEDPLPVAVGGWEHGTATGAVASSGTRPGADWSPVPVPLPTYVGMPVAPPRPARTIDLTQPGRDGDGVMAGQLGDEPDLELDDILDGRRAVGGW